MQENTTNNLNAGPSFLAFLEKTSGDDAEAYRHLEMEKDGEILEAEIFLANDADPWECEPGKSEKPSRASHEDNPYRPRWVESKNLEQSRLEAYKCWRKLTPSEEADWKRGKSQAVPCALLPNRKRRGRFTSRLVVLGNRWKADGQDGQAYAKIVPQIGNRIAMLETARRGPHPNPYDVTNALTRAPMGSIKVAATLPESFRDNPEDTGRSMRLRALYGLPISPRLWAKTLAKDLRGTGWRESKHEPGAWTLWKDTDRTLIGILTVYVDDCILERIDEKTARDQLAKMHARHPVTEIKTTNSPSGAICFDMLGADREINPKGRTLTIDMKKHPNKLPQRFDVNHAKAPPCSSF